jgi:hypothetical protein
MWASDRRIFLSWVVREKRGAPCDAIERVLRRAHDPFGGVAALRFVSF